MIGVVVPAHNEEALLATCIRAIQQAAAHPGLAGEPVQILLVLDSCDDNSAAIAALAGIDYLSVSARNVGYARAVGVEHLVALGARWIACTDADSEVATDWLVAQLALGADMVCGTVQVRDWGDIRLSVQQRYADAYTQADGHRHIHGANLGFCAQAYRRSGGFQHLSRGPLRRTALCLGRGRAPGTCLRATGCLYFLEPYAAGDYQCATARPGEWWLRRLSQEPATDG